MNKTTSRLTSPWRIIAAGKRPFPDFLIIGAQKCGTTSLYEYLKQHPGLSSNIGEKEIHFFDKNFRKGSRWYKSNFPLRREGVLYYEATPYYIFHPLAPHRVRDLLPNAKLIVMLRNPVDRTFSHYKWKVRRGRESLSFEEAIEREKERLEGEEERLIREPFYQSFNHRKFGYVARSKYIVQIKNWRKHFSGAEMLILDSKELQSDPENCFKRIFRFLDVESRRISIGKNHNPGNYADRIPSEIRARLVKLFESYNNELYRLLGRNFNWN